MNPPPRIARCERSLSRRSCRLLRVITMRQARRATCYRAATLEHRFAQIDIVDKLEKRGLEMIGNVDRPPQPVKFMVGSVDPLHVEPCGLMWDECCAQIGAQLAGWGRHEVQPGHRCRGAALRGMPNRHGIRNRIQVSRPVPWPDARASERPGMSACCHPRTPTSGVVVTGPCWGGH